jgi:hypothetical protein
MCNPIRRFRQKEEEEKISFCGGGTFEGLRRVRDRYEQQFLYTENSIRIESTPVYCIV